MKIPCSSCNQRLEIPEELAGQTIECPACNASLAVPAIAAPTSIPAQVQQFSQSTNKPSTHWALAFKGTKFDYYVVRDATGKPIETIDLPEKLNE